MKMTDEDDDTAGSSSNEKYTKPYKFMLPLQ